MSSSLAIESTTLSSNELKVLYEISKLFAQDDRHINDILAQVVKLIPNGWPSGFSISAEITHSDSFFSQADFNRKVYNKTFTLFITDHNTVTLTLFDLNTKPQQTKSFAIESKKYFIQALIEDLTLHISRHQTILVSTNKSEKFNKFFSIIDLGHNIARMGYWEYDILKNKIFWSDALYKVFGYDPQSVDLDLDFFNNTLHPDDKEMVNDAIAYSIENHSIYEVIYRGLKKNKDIIFIHCKGIVEYNDKQQASTMFGTGVDITLQQELKFAKEKAEKADQAKSKFLANMSHELRTPMHGILSFANFGIKKAQTANRDTLLKYFNRIKVSGDRLLILLNDLLDLSKLEAGQMDLDLKQHSLLNVLNSCLAELEKHITEQNIFIEKKVSSDCLADFDYIRISQVIINLLSNAIKFSAGKVFITIENNTLNSHPAICFSIEDNGIGIPEDELEGVFDKFVQSSKTKTHAGGTGLGLSICKEIIELHKGKIWVEHGTTEGSIFRFIIPRQKVATQPINLSTVKYAKQQPDSA